MSVSSDALLEGPKRVSDLKDEFGDAVSVVFAGDEKRNTLIPTPKNVVSNQMIFPTHEQSRPNVDHKADGLAPGLIIWAPHVYISPYEKSTEYNDDICAIASYWPAIILHQSSRSYFCLPIHSYSGYGPSRTFATGRKEYMYLTSDGKLTPFLSKEKVDPDHLLSVCEVGQHGTKQVFVPRDGATIPVTSHFDLPRENSYEILGSITRDSLTRLLIFYGKYFGFDSSSGLQSELARMKDDYRRVTSEAQSAAKELVNVRRRNKVLVLERNELQSVNSGLEAEIEAKQVELDKCQVLRQANDDLSNENSQLGKQLKVLQDHRKAETQSWTKNKAKLEAARDTLRAKVAQLEAANAKSKEQLQQQVQLATAKIQAVVVTGGRKVEKLSTDLETAEKQLAISKGVIDNLKKENASLLECKKALTKKIEEVVEARQAIFDMTDKTADENVSLKEDLMRLRADQEDLQALIDALKGDYDELWISHYGELPTNAWSLKEASRDNPEADDADSLHEKADEDPSSLPIRDAPHTEVAQSGTIWKGLVRGVKGLVSNGT